MSHFFSVYNLKANYYLLLVTIIFLISGCDSDLLLSELKVDLAEAQVKTNGRNLIVNTGSVERIWELTPVGLRTIAFRNNDHTVVFSNEKKNVLCDWSYNGIINNQSKSRIINLTARKSTDEGFTSEHIIVEAEFEYPNIETFVKYVIWAYPGASGIRTQLFIKGNGAKYMDENDLPKRDEITFELVNGTFNSNYKASAFVDLPIATATEDKEKVQYHIKGLSNQKKIKLGFTWWDFEGSGISQNIILTSTDGEVESQPIRSVQLPNFKNNSTGYEMNIIDVPKEIYLDDSFHLLFEKINGKKAVVSEIFIYEEGESTKKIVNGHDERMEEIIQYTPNGYSLIGYVDCGVPNTGKRLIPSGRVDYIPMNPKGMKLRFAGYYNDTQHRNKPETPLMREEEVNFKGTPVQNNWSSVVGITGEESGLILVKESHKCVNQYGNDTGTFEITEDGVSNTGTGLFPEEILNDKYSWCWASWSIIYDGGPDGMELAIKEFDRIRYPVDKKRDIYIQANTWGSDRGKNASREENVLIELESQKNLGIDIQQIDDGWQRRSIKMFDSQVQVDGAEADNEWHVREDWYPDGWKNVVAKSEETGVKLGLWGAAQPITLNALKWNYDQAGFVSYKLDFADFGTHYQMNELIEKVRAFIKYTDHSVRVNWDVTENAPRYGYYWAKEYGSVYIENRKPEIPKNAIYIPHLVLRDVWQLSKYTNVNRFQTSIQNIDMVDKSLSDAFMYNHPYVVAIGLIGTPLFFQETHFYSETARKVIKPVLTVYKKHREKMYEQFVYPIGDEPNNAGWPGFQWTDSDHSEGYLMVFRELNNTESKRSIRLRFLKDQNIRITNLLTGSKKELRVNSQGIINLEIKNKADYLFLHFEVF